MISLSFLSRVVCSVALLSFSSFAWAANASATCDLPTKQSLERWPFSMTLEERPLTWSARKTASDLFRTQGQYFSSKTSPFLNGSGIPALSFYQSGVSLEVEPRVNYLRTVDGRTCMMVVGATIRVVHAGNIELAKELVERSCVARQAMTHQTRHHEVVKKALQELVSVQNKLKPRIFEVYATKGAAGRNEKELINSLKKFNETAKAEIVKTLSPYIRKKRTSTVENTASLKRLAASCDGQFEKAITLARK